MGTFSAQYPPTEWFNPRVVHLHSVATQTRAASPSVSLKSYTNFLLTKREKEKKKRNKKKKRKKKKGKHPFQCVFPLDRRKLNANAEIKSRERGTSLVSFNNGVTFSDDGGSRSIAGQFPSMGRLELGAIRHTAQATPTPSQRRFL